MTHIANNKRVKAKEISGGEIEEVQELSSSLITIYFIYCFNFYCIPDTGCIHNIRLIRAAIATVH